MEKDKWTTLGESTDRIFSTSVEVSKTRGREAPTTRQVWRERGRRRTEVRFQSEWEYASDKAPFNECYERVKTAFIKNFAGESSWSITGP